MRKATLAVCILGVVEGRRQAAQYAGGQRRIVGHSQKELWVGRCLAEPSGEGEISHDGRRPCS